MNEDTAGAHCGIFFSIAKKGICMRLIGFVALSVLTTTLLSGCSVRMKNLADAAEEAIFGAPDITLSEAEIEQLPYAASYFKTNSSGQIVAVLDRATELQRVHRTAGEEAFTTRYGRVIASAGIPGMPLYTANWEADPLACWVEQTAETSTNDCATSWQRVVELGNYGSNALQQVQVSSTFEVTAQEPYRHPDGTELMITKIREQGTYGETSFSNEFYAVNGRVVFAKHYLSKDLGYGILQEIKPFNGDL